MPLYDCMLLLKPHVKKEAIMDLVVRIGKHIYSRNGVFTDLKSFGFVQLGYGIKKLDGRYYQPFILWSSLWPCLPALSVGGEELLRHGVPGSEVVDIELLVEGVGIAIVGELIVGGRELLEALVLYGIEIATEASGAFGGSGHCEWRRNKMHQIPKFQPIAYLIFFFFLILC
ncbi:hypothetical protein F2P56_021799 [Juglans regia]|uniref:Uncharacterized protein n=1 Tax=Juglans regia TaxID=51240 RepID=A0A833X357_JUGRE|nr:hypothetical protein F2P56_021799 [Juglans regia]